MDNKGGGGGKRHDRVTEGVRGAEWEGVEEK